jgi:ABC-2 type transport system permease protein
MQLLKIELYKIFKRPRTYISFGVVAAIAFVIQLAMYTNGSSFIEFAMKGVTEQFDVKGNILNGYLVAFIILQSLMVHIPLLITLVSGDTISGEAANGTLRLLLTKPISRTQLILAKFIASSIYTILLILWLAVVALALSLFIFGSGDLINLKSDSIIILLKDDLFWRYLLAFLFSILAMTTISAISILLSAFAANSIGPIVATMGIVIFLTILSTLDIPVINGLKPFLFTSHMLAWKGFFDDPVPVGSILRSALLLAFYITGSLTATIIYFNNKDINT